MGKITIFVIIGFAIALSSFLIHNYITGIAEDAVIDTTSQVVKESTIDEKYKEPFLGFFTLLKVAGGLAFIGGILTLARKYF